MKKLLFAVAVLMSAGTATFAQSNDSIPQQENQSIIAQVAESTYKEVKLEDLNEKLQAAINGYNESYTLKKIEYNEGEKLVRVTMEDKSTKVEKVITLNEEGKEI
ncbi:MAG: hypothetical protein LUH22_16520 [Bacteroides sp.]|nr:hypothetical protein [Bacteroides sp.]